MNKLLQTTHRPLFTLAALVILFLAACKKKDGYNDIVSDDLSKPGIVTDVKVSNFSGGAYITYKLPVSSNILYVQAEYNINDNTKRQTKSSYYSDTIKVSGFALSKDYKVTLHTVSRASVQSDSVVVTVHPETPPYLKLVPTVKINRDFGGVNIVCKNPDKASIGVIVITTDSYDKQQIVQQTYTDLDSINFSVRGYDTLARRFGVYFTDQWGNISDTTFATITPIYETLVPKSKFNAYVLPSDAPTGFGWTINNLWNNNIKTPGYHTTQPITPLVWPAVITFDMGQSAKLSRYTIWNRGLDYDGVYYQWTAGAPKTWVIWGRNDTPVNEVMPTGVSMPAVGEKTPNGWINLGSFVCPDKPSGLGAGQYTASDLALWDAGFSFNFNLSLPKVRYLRFQCLSNWSETNNYFNITELSFWGDVR
ncbi:DUF5000 domain-containing lipoprotein [Filimonas effusa]|uniref:DUF5126 domain-containing protein n=1 Tax=Filimonas effusa TaxID=2508721 RepID=A0A4Q1D878_9BACT|nr:DUF5000 domain-containing lipoprotein [Filimonas effusa]RXK85527.1 DUF5126 domain-containing protein [Filimonas effusa]